MNRPGVRRISSDSPQNSSIRRRGRNTAPKKIEVRSRFSTRLINFNMDPGPTYNEGYAQVAERDMTLSPSMIWPSRELVTTVFTLIDGAGCTGISSVGSGTAVLEWLLSEHFPPLSVRAIDPRSPCDSAKHRLLWCIDVRVVPVPDNHALMFCFPISRIPFEAYVHAYTGKCIVIIADSTCEPYPGAKEETAFLSEWDLTHRSPVCQQCLRIPVSAELFVFTRTARRQL